MIKISSTIALSKQYHKVNKRNSKVQMVKGTTLPYICYLRVKCTLKWVTQSISMNKHSVMASTMPIITIKIIEFLPY